MPRLEYTPPGQEDLIADFTADRRLAVLADPEWTGLWRLRFMLWAIGTRGYSLHLVHDDLPSIGRHPTYEGLERIPDRPEAALIISDPAVAPDLLKLAYQNGCKRVWLHSGSSSPEARARAEEYGLDSLHDLCPLCYLEPVRGFFALYRRLLEWLGRKKQGDGDSRAGEKRQASASEAQASKAQVSKAQALEAEDTKVKEDRPTDESV